MYNVLLFIFGIMSECNVLVFNVLKAINIVVFLYAE